MTYTRPWRLTSLQFSQIRLTLERTFMADLNGQWNRSRELSIVAVKANATRGVGIEMRTSRKVRASDRLRSIKRFCDCCPVAGRGAGKKGAEAKKSARSGPMTGPDFFFFLWVPYHAPL